MNKYAEYKEAYKAMIKEAAGIKDFINKGILPAFSRDKAKSIISPEIEALLADKAAAIAKSKSTGTKVLGKIHENRKIPGSLEQLLYDIKDPEKVLEMATQNMVNKARRNVAIGAGGAAALGGAGYGAYKALEPEETTTDKIMNALKGVFANADSKYTEELIKKAYAAELIKNAGIMDSIKKNLGKYLGNLSGSRLTRAEELKNKFVKNVKEPSVVPVSTNPLLQAVAEASGAVSNPGATMSANTNRLMRLNKNIEALKDAKNRTRTNTALGLGAIGTGAAGISALTPDETPAEKALKQLKGII